MLAFVPPLLRFLGFLGQNLCIFGPWQGHLYLCLFLYREGYRTSLCHENRGPISLRASEKDSRPVHGEALPAEDARDRDILLITLQ